MLFIKTEPEKKERTGRESAAYSRFLIELMLFLFFVNTFLVQSFVIPSGSMQNNLLIGDHLLVDKFSYSQSIDCLDAMVFPQRSIRRGMMVTFKAPTEPGKEYVKRVIGLPGERIRIQENTVFIDDRPLVEKYTFFLEDTPGQFHGETMSELLIPADSYFCMGDNRWNSSDSRFWGPVHRDLIVGRPWLIYWSIEADRNDYRNASLPARLKAMFSATLHFFSRTRWERTIKPLS